MNGIMTVMKSLKLSILRGLKLKRSIWLKLEKPDFSLWKRSASLAQPQKQLQIKSLICQHARSRFNVFCLWYFHPFGRRYLAALFPVTVLLRCPCFLKKLFVRRLKSVSDRNASIHATSRHIGRRKVHGGRLSIELRRNTNRLGRSYVGWKCTGWTT